MVTQQNLDETLTFKVIEFNRDDKRIIVSHSRFVDDVKREADDSVKAEKRKEREETRAKIKTTNSQVERATLGDLAGLQALKSQIADEAPKASTKKAAEAKVEAPKEEKAPAKKASAKSSTKGDDLKKIEGIGPKIAGLLNEDGIVTFEDLASAELSKLQAILEAAGSRYKNA